MFTSFHRHCLAASLIATALGCGNGSDSVYPAALATANSQRALAIGSVYEINGSYGAGCVGRQGAWSLALTQVAALSNAPLSVQAGNSECVLTLQSLRIGVDEETSAYFIASPLLVLRGDYAAMPSSFSRNGAGPAEFFANAAILPDAGFRTNFVIQVVYSDEPASASVAKTAESAVGLGGAVSIQGIPTPDYQASLASLNVTTNLAHVITSVWGSVELSTQGQSGESYAISLDDLGESPSYAEVDEAFRAANQSALSGPSHSISWEALDLVGRLLTAPIVRSIIVAHSVGGIRAYQVIRLTISE